LPGGGGEIGGHAALCNQLAVNRRGRVGLAERGQGLPGLEQRATPRGGVGRQVRRAQVVLTRLKLITVAGERRADRERGLGSEPRIGLAQHGLERRARVGPALVGGA